MLFHIFIITKNKWHWLGTKKKTKLYIKHRKQS